MASEIRVNTINSRTGFGTITVSETGQDLVGITTIENLTAENTLVGAAASFTGNVSVGGVLTYEDVTNIDSVGLITARQGIEIGARPGVGASISVDGNAIFSGITTFVGSLKADGGVDASSQTVTVNQLDLADTIVHGGDTNTKIRFPAADTVSIETAGSERLRVGSGGDVSVGAHATNYATSPLEVRGTTAGGDVAIRVTNNSTTAGTQAGIIFTTTTADYTTAGIGYERGGTADALRFYVGQSSGGGGFTNATERLRITSTGHMGLGVIPSAWPTNADSSGLQIGTGFAAFGRGSGDEDRGGISVNYYTDGSSNYYIGNGNANRIYMNDGNIDFQYAAANSSGAAQALTFTTAARITSSGDLLIGRTSTSTGHPLCVESDSSAEAIVIIGRTADDIGELSFFENDTTTRLGELQYRQDHLNFRHRVGDMRFCTGGSNEKMRLTTGGCLNIGSTTNTSYPLNVRTTTVTQVAKFESTVGTNEGTEVMIAKTGNSPADNDQVAYLQFSGMDSNLNSTIYGAIIQQSLDVTDGSEDGGMFFYNRNNAGFSQVLKINHDGTFTGSGSNDISDQRLKENITTITNATDKIKALKGRTFNWKAEAKLAEGTQYGFIAQEMEAVLPELVDDKNGIRQFYKDGNIVPQDDKALENHDEGTNYAKSVHISGVVPVLVEALKEALTRIETLESEVSALKSS